MTRRLIGAVQMRSTADVEANMSCILSFLREADERRCEHVAFPENAIYLGAKDGHLRAEGDLSRIEEELQSLRHVRSCSVGYMEPSGVDGKPFNSLSFLRKGAAAVSYRKIHLFDFAAAGLQESSRTSRGSDLVVCEGFGLSICYDLRFSSLYSALRDKGAEIILAPSAFTPRTGEAHWHALLKCRAIETQSMVVAAAQWGQHSEKRSSYGHTCIYDAWGTLVAQAPDGRDALVVAEFDEEAQRAIRTAMPVLEHRSPFH